MNKYIVIIFIMLTLIVLESFVVPAKVSMPVLGATDKDWSHQSFWYRPWGVSGVHKGIDIFAKKGTPVRAAQGGLVVYRGDIKLGGNVVLVMSKRGWLHYYAHLNTVRTDKHLIRQGEIIGSVGNSGNAKNKPPHLHYAVLNLIPRPLEFQFSAQGWKLMFYRNPSELII
ncbi:MAG TPA: M23 family metallopeptidase [Methylotenera sp.]|nr:M23 family metallopeptidase [Methylotenera sp.]